MHFLLYETEDAGPEMFHDSTNCHNLYVFPLKKYSKYNSFLFLFPRWQVQYCRSSEILSCELFYMQLLCTLKIENWSIDIILLTEKVTIIAIFRLTWKWHIFPLLGKIIYLL